MDALEIKDIFIKISKKIDSEKEYLTELDTVIGDSDHGINLARGFAAVEDKIKTLSDCEPSDLLKTVGMALVSSVGGASGPLYGTFFMKMAIPVKGKREIDLSDFIKAMEAGIEGVKSRGKSEKGEKTMLDAMIPAFEALKTSADEGISPKEAFVRALEASGNGVEYTKTIPATKGRASYLGDRSIGHQDPGATSFTMMLEILSAEISSTGES